MMRLLHALCARVFGYHPGDAPERRRHDRAMRSYINDAIGRGAGYEQQAQELRLRRALAELGRVASDWVREDPHDAARAISSSADVVRRKLSKEDAAIFAATVAQLGQGDILDRGALRAAKRAEENAKVTQSRSVPHPDDVASLRLR